MIPLLIYTHTHTHLLPILGTSSHVKYKWHMGGDDLAELGYKFASVWYSVTHCGDWAAIFVLKWITAFWEDCSSPGWPAKVLWPVVTVEFKKRVTVLLRLITAVVSEQNSCNDHLGPFQPNRRDTIRTPKHYFLCFKLFMFQFRSRMLLSHPALQFGLSASCFLFLVLHFLSVVHQCYIFFVLSKQSSKLMLLVHQLCYSPSFCHSSIKKIHKCRWKSAVERLLSSFTVSFSLVAPTVSSSQVNKVCNVYISKV